MACNIHKWERDMQKLQTKEEVEEYFSHEKIECLICGKKYKSLASHIVRVHGVTVEEYKDKFNLPYSRGLIGAATKNLQSERMKKRIADKDPSLMPIHEVAHIGQQKKNRYRDYTKEDMSKRITKHNIQDKSATMEQMEKYVNYLETHILRPMQIAGREKELGIISNATFARQRKKHPSLYRPLQKRIDVIPTARMKNAGERTRVDIRDEVFLLKNQGATVDHIATSVGIGRSTVKRILKKSGAWSI